MAVSPSPLLLLDFLLGLGRDLHLGPQLLGDAVEGRQVAWCGPCHPRWMENPPEMVISWGFSGNSMEIPWRFTTSNALPTMTDQTYLDMSRNGLKLTNCVCFSKVGRDFFAATSRQRVGFCMRYESLPPISQSRHMLGIKKKHIFHYYPHQFHYDVCFLMGLYVDLKKKKTKK